jgi:hypothetical protein
LRKYGETIAHIARSGMTLVERTAAVALRQVKGQRVEQYWDDVAAKASPQPEQDQAQNRSQQQGQML